MSRLLNTTIGEYRLVDFLGAGGMGEVYRGVHVRIGRVVAIKILSSADLDPTTVQRFLNEARIQSSLRHPGIATLYDFLESNGRPVIIMECVDGQTVAERISSSGPFAPGEAARVMCAVADTVAYIHSLNIIHRDLKTGNIKINSAGEVKLLDFGIAKRPFEARLTQTSSVIGTFQNLAPEQLEGKPATTQSDIWALGVVFYEMVTGHAPFDAANPTDLITNIRKAEYTAPSTWNPAVPREVEQVIAHCLKKRPGDRYQSATELSAALKPLTAGVSAGGDQKPKLHRLRITGSRRIAAVAAVVVLLAGGVLFYRRGEHPATASSGELAPAEPGKTEAAQSGAPLNSITLDVFGGTAEVFEKGHRIGWTPLTIRRPLGDTVNVILKREGFEDLPVQLDVTERQHYSYTMDAVKR